MGAAVSEIDAVSEEAGTEAAVRRWRLTLAPVADREQTNFLEILRC